MHFLSQEHCAAATAAFGADAELGRELRDVNLTIVYFVSAGQRGDFSYHLKFTDGIAVMALGELDEPRDAQVRSSYDTAARLARAEINSQTAVMLGFLVAAIKDPEGANLDRVQIIKGWLAADGTTHENVYEVKWSGDGKPDASGKVPPVGNTVDRTNATCTNTIGAPELAACWQDPDFDPKAKAFYYVRVLEIPTPRWTAYDVVRFKEKMPAKVPMTLQERGLSSPSWYDPDGSNVATARVIASATGIAHDKQKVTITDGD